MKNCLLLFVFSFFLFIEIMENYSQHLSFFHFSCENAIFLFFHFLNTIEKTEKLVRINIIFSFFRFSIFGGKRENRKMIQESEIISFFSFSNNSKKIKNNKMSLLAVYSIFCISDADFKIRKMKKLSIFLTIFFFSIFDCALKYVNIIRVNKIYFFRFCWKMKN